MRLEVARWLLAGAVLLLAGCADGPKRSDFLRPLPDAGWTRTDRDSASYDAGKFSVEVDEAGLYYDDGKGPLFARSYKDPQFSVRFKSLGARLIVDPRKAVFAEPCGPGARQGAQGAADFALGPRTSVVWGDPVYVLPAFPAVLEPGQDLTVVFKLRANSLRIAQCSLDLSRAILAPEDGLPPVLRFVRQSVITPAP